MRKLAAIPALIFVVVMIAGFTRDNNVEFKARCAAYQSHMGDTLSFPDKMVCLTFYKLKD